MPFACFFLVPRRARKRSCTHSGIDTVYLFIIVQERYQRVLVYSINHPLVLSIRLAKMGVLNNVRCCLRPPFLASPNLLLTTFLIRYCNNDFVSCIVPTFFSSHSFTKICWNLSTPPLHSITTVVRFFKLLVPERWSVY